jgi:hypothetical protein
MQFSPPPVIITLLYFKQIKIYNTNEHAYLTTRRVLLCSSASASLRAVASVMPVFVRLKVSRCVLLGSASNSWVNFSSEIFCARNMINMKTVYGNCILSTMNATVSLTVYVSQFVHGFMIKQDWKGVLFRVHLNSKDVLQTTFHAHTSSRTLVPSQTMASSRMMTTIPNLMKLRLAVLELC